MAFSSMISNNAHVRVLPDESDMKIIFSYKNELREFNRLKSDSVSKTLRRICLKLVGKKSKKKKNKLAADADEFVEIAVELRNESGQPIDGEIPNVDAFIEGSILCLANESYSIILNPPSVLLLQLPTNIMSGFIALPSVELEFADTGNSVFNWYKKASEENKSEWTSLGHGLTYTPSNLDIGCFLKLTCSAGNDTLKSSIIQECVSPNPVSASPGICLFEQRQMYTRKHHELESKEFRIVSYNILADMFATSEYAKNTLFPFCPEYVLSMSYRKQLIVKELLGYHADFVCLQECGMKLFNTYLKPILNLHGYVGFFDLKLGAMPEGEALFYRGDRYAHVKDLTVSVRDAMYMGCNKHIIAELTNAPELLQSIHKKTAIGQIHVLREKHGTHPREICILNTHLYYKRFYQHVRTLQMAILMNYVQETIDTENITLIVCGDLNSLRTDVLLKYLSGDRINADDPVWLGLGESRGLVNFSLESPKILNNLSGCPEFTSFVPHCVDTLDYIFGDCNLALSAFVPLPTAEVLMPYIGIPCLGSPSDHLALVLDLIWK